jgi:hypothetical protein
LDSCCAGRKSLEVNMIGDVVCEEVEGTVEHSLFQSLHVRPSDCGWEYLKTSLLLTRSHQREQVHGP